jgi:hypothetical protein
VAGNLTPAPIKIKKKGNIMALVSSYSILFYGSPEGYQTNRAQIQLSDAAGKVLAWIRFNDPGMFFEADANDGGIIRMHLPSTMFQSVLDVLRNEQPINIYFAAGRGFLGTSLEPVGEGE